MYIRDLTDSCSILSLYSCIFVFVYVMYIILYVSVCSVQYAGAYLRLKHHFFCEFDIVLD